MKPLKKVGEAHFQMKQCLLQEVKDEFNLNSPSSTHVSLESAKLLGKKLRLCPCLGMM